MIIPAGSYCNSAKLIFASKITELYWHFIIYFDFLMEIYLEQIKANDKFHENNLGFVDSGFVKTCDELVIGP